MKDKIIDFVNEIESIDFCDISNRNPFTTAELNEIVIFKIDLLFRNHFPKEYKKRVLEEQISEELAK